MAHPHSEHRQHHVEKRRVAHLTKGYAAGGAVEHDDDAQDKKLVKRMVKKTALRADGGAVHARADKPRRARGGRMKKGKGSTTVNVITGHPGVAPMAAMGGAPPPVGAMAAPPPAAAAPPMPPPRPMTPPPGPGGAMPPPGMAPPGMMPPRAGGGRTYKKGGRVNDGSPVYNASVKDGTQVTHSPGKNDGKDLNRKRVVTFMAGGRVPKRASGGRTEHPDKGGMAPTLPGGAGGGEARLAKARMAKRK